MLISVSIVYCDNKGAIYTRDRFSPVTTTGVLYARY